MMQKLEVLSVAELVWLAQKAGIAPALPGIASKSATYSSPRHGINNSTY
jgi:hypothetical protein